MSELGKKVGQEIQQRKDAVAENLRKEGYTPQSPPTSDRIRDFKKQNEEALGEAIAYNFLGIERRIAFDPRAEGLDLPIRTIVEEYEPEGIKRGVYWLKNGPLLTDWVPWGGDGTGGAGGTDDHKVMVSGTDTPEYLDPKITPGYGIAKEIYVKSGTTEAVKIINTLPETYTVDVTPTDIPNYLDNKIVVGPGLTKTVIPYNGTAEKQILISLDPGITDPSSGSYFFPAQLITPNSPVTTNKPTVSSNPDQYSVWLYSDFYNPIPNYWSRGTAITLVNDPNQVMTSIKLHLTTHFTIPTNERVWVSLYSDRGIVPSFIENRLIDISPLGIAEGSDIIISGIRLPCAANQIYVAVELDSRDYHVSNISDLTAGSLTVTATVENRTPMNLCYFNRGNDGINPGIFQLPDVNVSSALLPLTFPITPTVGRKITAAKLFTVEPFVSDTRPTAKYSFQIEDVGGNVLIPWINATDTVSFIEVASGVLNIDYAVTPLNVRMLANEGTLGECTSGQFSLELSFSDTTDPAPTIDGYALLTSAQLFSAGANTATLELTQTRSTAGSVSLGQVFRSLSGTPGVTQIPAGPWTFDCFAYTDGGASDETNQIRCDVSVWRNGQPAHDSPFLTATSNNIGNTIPGVTTFTANQASPITTTPLDNVVAEYFFTTNTTRSRTLTLVYSEIERKTRIQSTFTGLPGTGTIDHYSTLNRDRVDSHPASAISVNTSTFTRNLTVADNTVQKALNTLDQMVGGGGEVNTASNANTGGVGVWKDKVGVNLRFKGVKAGSSKITVTDTPGTSTIDLDVATASTTQAGALMLATSLPKDHGDPTAGILGKASDSGHIHAYPPQYTTPYYFTNVGGNPWSRTNQATDTPRTLSFTTSNVGSGFYFISGEPNISWFPKSTYVARAWLKTDADCKVSMYFTTGSVYVGSSQTVTITASGSYALYTFYLVNASDQVDTSAYSFMGGFSVQGISTSGNLTVGTGGVYSTVVFPPWSSTVGFEKTVNKGVANGYTPLDGTIKVPIANLPTGTTSTTVCIGNDSRLSDDRIAYALRSLTTVVNVSAATAPTTGQVLRATAGTTATWQTLTPGDIGALPAASVSGTSGTLAQFGSTGATLENSPLVNGITVTSSKAFVVNAVGQALSASADSPAGTVRMAVTNTSNTSGSFSSFILNTGTGSGFEFYKYGAVNSYGVGLNNYDAGEVFIATTNTRRLTVAATGEVGVGLVPAAGYSFQVGGASNGSFRLTSNAETNGLSQTFYFGTPTYNRALIRSTNIGTIGGSAISIYTSTAAGNLAQVQTLLETGAVAFPYGPVTIGSSGTSTTGSVVLNGSTSGAITHGVAATTASYSLLAPTTAPGTDQCIVYPAGGGQGTWATIGAGGVPTSRTLTAGAGLTGGGDLTADRTFNVVAADGSITVNADSIQVGIISDSNHGPRGGGTLHSVVTTSVAGFMSAADKTKLDGLSNISFSTSTPAAIVVGGAGSAGSISAASKSDHVHPFPAFGNSAGTLCEGNDGRLSNDRTTANIRTGIGSTISITPSIPSNGMVLTATSGTVAVWQTPTAYLTGSGITNYLAIFSGSTSLTYSPLSYSSGTLTVTSTSHFTSTGNIEGTNINTSANSSCRVGTSSSIGGTDNTAFGNSITIGASSTYCTAIGNGSTFGTGCDHGVVFQGSIYNNSVLSVVFHSSSSASYSFIVGNKNDFQLLTPAADILLQAMVTSGRTIPLGGTGLGLRVRVDGSGTWMGLYAVPVCGTYIIYGQPGL